MLNTTCPVPALVTSTWGGYRPRGGPRTGIGCANATEATNEIPANKRKQWLVSGNAVHCNSLARYAGQTAGTHELQSLAGQGKNVQLQIPAVGRLIVDTQIQSAEAAREEKPILVESAVGVLINRQ